MWTFPHLCDGESFQHFLCSRRLQFKQILWYLFYLRVFFLDHLGYISKNKTQTNTIDIKNIRWFHIIYYKKSGAVLYCHLGKLHGESQGLQVLVLGGEPRCVSMAANREVLKGSTSFLILLRVLVVTGPVYIYW